MNIKTVVDITSTELEQIIVNRFQLEEFNIIADQEAGNEILVRETSTPFYAELENEFPLYKLQTYLDILAHEGLIPSGTYNIDCTY